MNNSYGILGMAMRARKLNVGNAVIEDIRNKRAKLVIVAKDASENTKKRLMDKCQFYGIEYLFIESSDELNHAIGKSNVMSISVVEEGFAKKIRTCLKG